MNATPLPVAVSENYRKRVSPDAFGIAILTANYHLYMSSNPESTVGLAEQIEATDKKIQSLNEDLASIGELASHSLRHRLEAIKVEEHALQRNFAELRGNPELDQEKVRKVETLLHHIEAEEAALEHEAAFLNQGNRTTLEFVFQFGSRAYDRGASWMKKAMRNRRVQ